MPTAHIASPVEPFGPSSTHQLHSPRARPTSFTFFFNDTATTEIYTLSLHDALPISPSRSASRSSSRTVRAPALWRRHVCRSDRKSTRLNSSHQIISYAVFCLKKKKGGMRMKNALGFITVDWSGVACQQGTYDCCELF